MTGEGGYSLSDIAAAMGNRSGWGNNDFLYLLFLFAFGGGNGFGFGRAGNAVTQLELQNGFDNQSVLRKLDGITNGLCDGFYATNTNMLQGQNHLQRDLCQGFSSTAAAIAETNRNIDAVRYEAAKNTCDIVRAIEKDGDATRALINANTMQALRDKIAEKDQMLQTANFQLSQQAQSANLINELRPCAKPAYITCSPYQSQNYGYNFGCGCSCGY
jgi:hypothetical protein